MTSSKKTLLESLEQMSATELRRVLAEHLTQQKLGLYWERNAIEHDKALNAHVVLPRLVPEWSHTPTACIQHQNLIIEGDNFDSLRLLRSTHAGRIRVIYIDPPYNTGNKDWVYNDSYVGANDRWRHSQWLEFLYQRLTLARELLAPDGVILVSINDENRSRNAGFSFNGRATDRSKFRNQRRPRPVRGLGRFQGQCAEGADHPVFPASAVVAKRTAGAVVRAV